MFRLRTDRFRRVALFGWLFAGLLTMAVPALGQTPKSTAPTATPATAVGDYTIGPGDILAITVSDSPELSGKFRVTDGGYVVVPVLATPIKAEGLTASELSKSIVNALLDAKQLQSPVVSVFIEEYHSQNVTVLGAVAKPSLYPLQKRTTVLEVISMAGGLIPAAGNTVTIARGAKSSASGEAAGADPTSASAPSTLTIDLARLAQGKDPSLNVEVHAGDIVSVSTAPIIYVVGAVVKPGGFAMQDPSSGLTVLQAVAMAQGLTSVAAGDRGMIIRQSANRTNREEIPVNLSKLMESKVHDQALEPNDILFVPESGMKKSLHRMGEIAVSAINGIAIYGVGYRAAGIN